MTQYQTEQRNNNLRNVLILSGVVILAMFALSTYVWTQIPAGEQVCTHWNAAGECDDYGNKFVGIYLMPLIVTAVVGLFSFIPRIEPRAIHLAQSRKAYTAVWGIMLLFFFGLHSALMLEILGGTANIGFVVPILIGILFIVIGNYLGKVRSNFFFGIRTPWTLSSELSWNKTHRLGGKLFMLLGFAFIVGALVSIGEAWIFVLIGGILLMTLTLVLYSYFVWKSDAEAQGHAH
ncbi:MAG: SdpI family protein [Chloroflexota bacterium]